MEEEQKRVGTGVQTRRKAPRGLDKWRVTRTWPAGEAVFTTVGLRGVAGLHRGCSPEAGNPRTVSPPNFSNGDRWSGNSCGWMTAQLSVSCPCNCTSAQYVLSLSF